MLRAKVLYGTEASIKKPKFDHEMEFKSFHFENEQEFYAYREEVKDEFIYTGVDLTTLSKILEEGEF